MKKIRQVLVPFFCILLILALNSRFGIMPPIGKLLSPFKGYLQNSTENAYSDTIELDKDLNSPVKIYFDERKVPHIFAENEQDLYFAQGYLHARERLWQMDFIYRIASGRLSELLGDITLDKDRCTRRKGMGTTAENSLKFIKSKQSRTYEHLEHYSLGVNAFIKSLSPDKYPLEFKMLDYSPEEWTPLKTLFIQSYMADMLSGYDEDVEKTNALLLFGKAEYELLYKTVNEKLAPMIDTFAIAGASMDDSTKLSSNLIYYGEQDLALHGDLHMPNPKFGSNTWVISARKAKKGFPILANDPHLSLTLPSIWYEIQLADANMNAYGVSIPGVPYIIIGFNENIAWGITSGGTDIKDWYALKSRNNSEYQLGNKWKNYERKVEKFIVYGSGQIVDTILYTELGPVVYDKNFHPSSETVNMALKWEANATSNNFNTFYLLNKAGSWEDYNEAIKNFTFPLNFSFASKNDIAISHEGRIPVRKTNTGEFVIDGTSFTTENSEIIPEKLLPKEKNPLRGFVWSANQIPTGANYPYRMYGYYEEYRNKTIKKELALKDKLNREDMINLQLNNFDLFASEALPVMLKQIKPDKLSQEEKEIIDTLSKWNFYTSGNSIAPRHFYTWWHRFYIDVWDEVLKSGKQVNLPSPNKTIGILELDPQCKYFDIKSTAEKENASDLLHKSLKHRADACKKENGKKSWGVAKATFFEHIASLPGLSSDVVVCSGSQNAVNACMPNWGPTWRMIVEFSNDGPKAWGINPGGQSGLPGSIYYGSEIQNWVKGEYHQLDYLKNSLGNSDKYQLLILQK